MEIITALLAFAVTMLAMATIVTVLLEIIARFSQRRLRIFKHMLTQVFETELRPIVEKRLQRENGGKNTADAASKAREAFVNAISCTPYKPRAARGFLSTLGFWIVHILGGLNGGEQSTKLDRDTFITRLARSEAGSQIYSEFKGDVDEAVERIARRYDELSASSREYIKNSSAVVTLILGVLVALVLNVDGYRILTYYVDHPGIAEKVANDAERTLKNYEAAERKLDETLQKLDAATADAAAVSTHAQAARDIDEIKTTVKQINETLGDFQNNNVPIGFEYEPHCYLFDVKGSSHPCATDLAGKDILLWLVKAILTGLLIGLGGPFWYDAVKGLMRVTQMLRGRTEPSETAAQATTPTGQTETTVEKFKNTVKPAPKPGRPYSGPLWRPQPDRADQPKDGA